MVSDQTILDTISRAKIIAGGIHRTLPPNSVQLDDLVQVGMLGLLGAAKTFNNDVGTPFVNYAQFRIRGAIKDFLRTSIPGYSRWSGRFATTVSLTSSTDEQQDVHYASRQLALAQTQQLRKILNEALSKLSVRERRAVVLYWDVGWTQKEIAFGKVGKQQI